MCVPIEPRFIEKGDRHDRCDMAACYCLCSECVRKHPSEPPDTVQYRTAFCHACRCVQVFLMDGSQELEQTVERRDQMKRYGCEPCSPKDVIAKCEVCCELRPFHPVEKFGG